MNALVGSPLCPRRVRRVLLNAWGLDVRTSGIMERCFFGGREISLGRSVFLNVGCVIDNSGPVRIEDECRLGMGVVIATSTHEFGGPERRAGEVRALPVTVKRGSWLASSVTVLPGVTIGEGCIVGAGSVVTTDLAPNGLYVGTPAKRVRNLPT